MIQVLRFLPRFRAAYREMPTLAAREKWSRGEIEAFQLDRLNAVWGHAIKHVPHYRDLRARRDLPERYASLAEYREALPVLPKAVVRQTPEAFLSEKAEPGSWRRTSGSTGIPTRVYWGALALQEVLRSKYRFQLGWGVDIFDRQAFLWGNGVRAFHPGLKGLVTRFKQPIEDRLRNRVRLPAYQLGPADLRAHLRRLERTRPAALYAYSSAAYLIAQEAKRVGFRCPSLKVVMMSAEPVYPHVARAVEAAFGVPAVNEYGASEVGVLANEGPDRVLRVREDIVLIETQPRDDGRHDILVSVLTNPSFPLLRYAVGDVTDAPLERPARGFAALANVCGRDNDFLLTRSGRPLHSVRFDYLFETAPGVRRYQVRQAKDGGLAVRVEATDPAAPPDVAAIRAAVAELVEGYPVEVAVVDAIPPTPSGKHRWVFSELAPSWGASEEKEPALVGS